MRKKKSIYKDFANCVESFFQKYHILELGSSHNTIRSYSTTFEHFIEFIETFKRVKADDITWEIIDVELIREFLRWLETSKGNSISTRNQRMAALKSFFQYMISIDPIHMDKWKSLLKIKGKKHKREMLTYLSVEGINLLISQIDTSQPKGLRDFTLLSLLYTCALRVEEITKLRVKDVRNTKPSFIIVSGKGNKQRPVPIDDDMVNLLNRYMSSQGLLEAGKEDHFLFFNCWHEQLTTEGVRYVLGKYVTAANAQDSLLVPQGVTPHWLRHSRAMHLLKGSVSLVYIRDFLGHTSVITTEVYAKADASIKQKALEQAYSINGKVEPETKSWDNKTKLKDRLRALRNKN